MPTYRSKRLFGEFRLVGFTDFHQVRITSVMSASRDTQLAEKINLSIAKSLNKKLI